MPAARASRSDNILTQSPPGLCKYPEITLQLPTVTQQIPRAIKPYTVALCDFSVKPEPLSEARTSQSLCQPSVLLSATLSTMSQSQPQPQSQGIRVEPIVGPVFYSHCEAG